MTKREMIEELAQQYPQFPRRRVEALVNEVFAGMAAALAQGERVELRGWGTFRVKDRPARTHYNPRTRAPVAIAAQRVLAFRASKVFLRRVNGKPSQADCQPLPAQQEEREDTP